MHLLWITILGNTSKIVGTPIRSVKISLVITMINYHVTFLTFRVIHEQGSPLLLVVYLLYDCPKKINNSHYLVDNPVVSPLSSPFWTPRARVYESSLRLFRHVVHPERELFVVLLSLYLWLHPFVSWYYIHDSLLLNIILVVP